MILLRPAQQFPYEVFLVRRADTLPFMGGFHAFPGGTTEDVDNAQHFSDDPRAHTALRELFEETGVLVVHERNLEAQERAAWRRATLEKPAAWCRGLEKNDLRVHLDQLIPFGTWTTPPYALQRFAARYYALWLPEGEAPDIWPGELVDGLWATPSQALERHHAGHLFITYPVLETLKAMVRTAGDLAAAARALEAFEVSPFADVGGEMIAGVHMLPLRTFTLPPATHTNCYLLGHDDLVVVDPASPIPEEQDRLIAYIDHLTAQGAALRELWLTHEHKDHIGAVARLRDHYQIPVAAHPLTAQALPPEVTVDRYIAPDEVMNLRCGALGTLRWRALHTPGHARGHLCFYEENRGAMLSGDNVLGMGTVIVAPPEGNMSEYMTSLERMRDTVEGFLFPAHGPPVAAAKKWIQHYIDHRTARETNIFETLDAPQTVEEIVSRVYTDVDPKVFPLAAKNVQAHLEKLVIEGRAKMAGGRYQKRF